MAEKKTTKYIQKKNFTFFGGIAICIFSVILILNGKYFARAIAFPFAYLFGLGSYLLYILFYAYGLYLFFKEKSFRLKNKIRILGFLFIFLATLIIGTLIAVATSSKTNGTEMLTLSNYSSRFADVMKNIDGLTDDSKAYWNATFINLFQGNDFGGGFVGYFLTASLCTAMKTTGAWVVAVLIALLGLFFFFYPQFKKILGKKKSPSENKSKNVKKIERLENRDVITSASQIEEMNEDEEKPLFNQSINKPASYDNRNSEIQNTTFNNTPRSSFSETTNLVPARFMKYMPKAEVKEIVEEKPVKTPEQLLMEENKRSTRNEQLQLDFNKPQIDETLAATQPTFDEPVNKPHNNPIPIPQPVEQIEKPVERKPIKWVPPSTDMLETLEVSDALEANNKVAEERLKIINGFFEDFHIGAECISYVVGPSVTRYNITYKPNVSVKSVSTAIQDISLRLGGVSARFEEIVRGKPYSGLEVPNARITSVSFKEVYESLPDVKKHPLAVAFGKNIDGDVICADFDEFPHVLVAGTTGSGKSVFTHSVVSTLIMRNSPENLKLVLIDPKKVEMNKYRDLPHLLCPIINDANIAKLTISKLCDEMNRRYGILDDNYVSNISQYNELLEDNPNLEKLPYIVVIVDEYADLVDTCKDIKMPVVSIAQKARAAGIHMLIATQRPSANIVDGVIKGNLPTRVALAVASYVDSTTILGLSGAEKLLGKGDMLVQSPLISRDGATRMQSCYIQNKEIARIVGYLKQHYECIYDPNYCNLMDASAQAAKQVIGSPEFQEAQDNSEEAKYQSVKEWVMSNQYMSMSRIQREMSVGFNRAGKFFKRLQQEGVVAWETEGNKGCPVLIKDKFYDGSADSDIPASTDQSELI